AWNGRYPDSFEGFRERRMARTRASPGLCALWKRMAAVWAALGGAPTIRFWKTSAPRSPGPAELVTVLAHSAVQHSRARPAAAPVYRAQFAGTLSSPGCTTGLPLAAVSVAPPMMLLIARAATWRLSIGLAGLYGWCRFSDQATWPPWDGRIGSRPCRPVLIDA